MCVSDSLHAMTILPPDDDITIALLLASSHPFGELPPGEPVYEAPARTNWLTDLADRMATGVKALNRLRAEIPQSPNASADMLQAYKSEDIRLRAKAEGMKLCESYALEAARDIPEFVTMGYFRLPPPTEQGGEVIHTDCGYRFHDHGFIDFGSWGLPVCPSSYGPFPGQSVAHIGRAASMFVKTHDEPPDDRDSALADLRDFLFGGNHDYEKMEEAVDFLMGLKS